MNERKAITVRVPVDVYEWVKATANEECRTKSGQVALFLKQLKEKHDKQVRD